MNFELDLLLQSSKIICIPLQSNKTKPDNTKKLLFPKSNSLKWIFVQKLKCEFIEKITQNKRTENLVIIKWNNIGIKVHISDSGNTPTPKPTPEKVLSIAFKIQACKNT